MDTGCWSFEGNCCNYLIAACRFCGLVRCIHSPESLATVQLNLAAAAEMICVATTSPLSFLPPLNGQDPLAAEGRWVDSWVAIRRIKWTGKLPRLRRDPGPVGRSVIFNFREATCTTLQGPCTFVLEYEDHDNMLSTYFEDTSTCYQRGMKIMITCWQRSIRDVVVRTFLPPPPHPTLKSTIM